MIEEKHTLIRWGNAANEHIRMEGEKIIVEFDVGGPLVIGPIADVTERKAMWADVQWIVAKSMERGSEIAPERWKKLEAVVQAGDRIVALGRAVMHHGEYLVQSGTLDLCLDAYDEAKRMLNAKSVFERLRDPDPFSGEPSPEPKEPEDRQESLPEPETENLYEVYYLWQARYDEVLEALETLKQKHQKDGPRYNLEAPCPADLARAYKRLFKVKPVLHYLWQALSAQVDPHLGQLLRDPEGKDPVKPNEPTSMIMGITWLTTILNPRPAGAPPAPPASGSPVVAGLSEWAPVAEGVEGPWDGEPPAQ